MPVKRRAGKRRINSEVHFNAWELVFAAGRDFFGELPAIGTATDIYGRPGEQDAIEAWRVLGRRFLAERKPDAPQAWAEMAFGRPWEVCNAC